MRSLFPKLLFAFALISPVFSEPAPNTPKHEPANVKEDVLSIPKVEVKDVPVKDDTLTAPKAASKDEPVNAGAAAGTTNSKDTSDKPTTFNAMEVPPMKELDGSKFGEQIKEGYWCDPSSPVGANKSSIASANSVSIGSSNSTRPVVDTA